MDGMQKHGSGSQSAAGQDKSLAVTVTGGNGALVETAGAAAAAQAKASVEARHLVAMHRPRSWMTVRAKLLEACDRPGFAESAIYSKPIGKDRVTGLSIRFAEEAARAMGNMLIESSVTFDDAERRLIRVTAMDLENNATWSLDVTVEKTIERKFIKQGQEVLGQRTNSQGAPVYILRATDDDVVTKGANLTSKAVRTCILRIVPGDIQEEAEERILATMQNRDAADPQGQTKKMADKFYALGVMPDAIEKLLGHPLAQTNAAEIHWLRSIYTAMREGEATWADVVASGNATGAEPENGNGGAQEPTPKGATGLKARLAKSAAPKAQAPAVTEEAVGGE